MRVSRPPWTGGAILLLALLRIVTPSFALFSDVALQPRCGSNKRYDRRESLLAVYGSTGGPEVWDVFGLTDHDWVEAPTVATIISDRTALFDMQRDVGNGSLLTTLTDANGSAHTFLYNRPPQPSAQAVAWFLALKIAIGSFVIQTPFEFLNGPPGISQAARLLNAVNGRRGWASVAPCNLTNSTNLYALAQQSPVLASLKDGRLVALHTTAPPGYAPLSAVKPTNEPGIPSGVRFAVMFANFHAGGPNTMDVLESEAWFSQCKQLLYLPLD